MIRLRESQLDYPKNMFNLAWNDWSRLKIFNLAWNFQSWPISLENFIPREWFSECAKGAEKASCEETVVQKGVFQNSVSSLPPYRCFTENLKRADKKRTLQKNPFERPFLRTTPSPLLWWSDKIQGPSWGQQKRRKPSFLAPFPTFWVFWGGLKWLKGGLKWLKVA